MHAKDPINRALADKSQRGGDDGNRIEIQRDLGSLDVDPIHEHAGHDLERASCCART